MAPNVKQDTYPSQNESTTTEKSLTGSNSPVTMTAPSNINAPATREAISRFMDESSCVVPDQRFVVRLSLPSLWFWARWCDPQRYKNIEGFPQSKDTISIAMECVHNFRPSQYAQTVCYLRLTTTDSNNDIYSIHSDSTGTHTHRLFNFQFCRALIALPSRNRSPLSPRLFSARPHLSTCRRVESSM